MKKLNELYKCDYDVEINDIKINSRDILPGDLFVCTKGATTDRHDFIENAINNGAAAIVVSKDVDYPIPTIKVDNTNEELPKLCKSFYNNSDERISVLGVTGTDGKTSVSSILQTLIGNKECANIGTNGRSWAGKSASTTNTTPDADVLYRYFDEFINDGCSKVIMEASSEAFYNGRLKNLMFDISGYTNITREHLNTHGTLENYIDCKLDLFRQTKKDGYSILNKDDKYFDLVKAACKASILTYGTGSSNTLQIKDYELTPRYTNIKYGYGNKEYFVKSPMLADFNVYNLACALLMGIASGHSIESLLENVENINVPGRLDSIDLGQDFYTIVDYAHTPNGIASLLKFIKTLDVNNIITVIGQAGERDKDKRKEVGEIVASNSDIAIFTSEDPRSEDPNDIIDDMTENIKDKDNYLRLVDRKEAIQKAINMAKENDMVLVLGKGCENYQKLKNETIEFSDIVETENAIRRLKK